MKQPTLIDYVFLVVLALIWASAFFNIKIATYSYGPVTIAFLRILLGAIPVVGLFLFKKIKIEAFSKDWYWFASIGIINLVIPFFLIAYGVQKVQSNLAAILMASTPLSATLLAHLFTDNEKINIFVDNSLERFEDIFAAAGHPNCVFKIDFKNLLKITQGKIKDIVE